MHSNCIAKVYQAERIDGPEIAYTELASFSEGSAAEKAFKAMEMRDKLNQQRKYEFGERSLSYLWYTAEMEDV